MKKTKMPPMKKVKEIEPSGRFVKEMERMYPQGATITPKKPASKPKKK